MQYIVQHRNDKNHKYHEKFVKVIVTIGMDKLKSYLLKQLEKLLLSSPPPRRIQSEFGNDSIRQEWAEANLREQLTILQILTLIASEDTLTDTEFINLFKLFKKHNFSKNQGYNDFLEERHREACVKIMYMELGLFTIILDGENM